MQKTRVAIVGFGMSGVGAAYTLRTEAGAQVALTLFEAGAQAGGKVKPGNEGAQFMDARCFAPMDAMVAAHGLVTRTRPDYDSAPFELSDGRMWPGERFIEALQLLRREAATALKSRPWAALDHESALGFIDALYARGLLDHDGREAMARRLGFEEGTQDISALSFCINLGKSETPMDRVEVQGGLHALVEREAEAVVRAGGTLRLNAPVHAITREGPQLRVAYSGGTECFDAVIVAAAPEQLAALTLRGFSLPVERIAALRPARVTKTNLLIRGALPASEQAGARYAFWHSPLADGRGRLTFFHGWEGEAPLTTDEMLKIALGSADRSRLVSEETVAWDATGPAGPTRHGYTTLPRPGEGLGVVELAHAQFTLGTYDPERLFLANHVLGLGCYTRDAALAGQQAAHAVLRATGLAGGRARAA
jgi:hypothetical protein